MNTIPFLLIIFSAFAGFLLSLYIHHKKKRHEKMLCLLKSDCDAVIHSKFSRFFGIPIELLGLFYYAIVAISYAVFLAAPHIVSIEIVFGVLVLTTAALLFSMYLTFLQAFSLKQWCTWCLTSAGICVIIFFSALMASEFSFITLLSENRTFIIILHAIAVAVGLGAATITDILFFKFLKDLRISELESDILHTLSQAIWFALAIIITTGIALYLPGSDTLLESTKFLAKMVVVLIIVINGAILNLLVAPKLVNISFGKKHQHERGELHHLRKFSFALGSVSIISWYTAFILGMLRSIPLSVSYILLIYGVLLAAGIIASQFVEKSFSKRTTLE